MPAITRFGTPTIVTPTTVGGPTGYTVAHPAMVHMQSQQAQPQQAQAQAQPAVQVMGYMDSPQGRIPLYAFAVQGPSFVQMMPAMQAPMQVAGMGWGMPVQAASGPTMPAGTQVVPNAQFAQMSTPAMPMPQAVGGTCGPNGCQVPWAQPANPTVQGAIEPDDGLDRRMAALLTVLMRKYPHDLEVRQAAAECAQYAFGDEGHASHAMRLWNSLGAGYHQPMRTAGAPPFAAPRIGL